MIFKKTVSCDTCKCLLKKEDAQVVTGKGLFINGLYMFYFCKSHRVKYDSFTNVYNGKMYMKNIPVTSDGEPVGYIKEVPKKK